jgi:hypothetical protein
MVERRTTIDILLVHLTSDPNQCEYTWILALSGSVVQRDSTLCILQLEVGTTAYQQIETVN